MEGERPREANASPGRSPFQQGPLPRSVWIEMGSGPFSRFRPFPFPLLVLDVVMSCRSRSVWPWRDGWIGLRSQLSGSRLSQAGDRQFLPPVLRPRGVTGMRHAHKLLPMRRSTWTRVIALFVGIWFVAAAAGPELTHACPMHGGHSSAASAAEHADHGAVAEHHPASSSESPSHHGTQCTCLGQCCSTGPVAVLSARTALSDTDTVATRDAGLPDYAYVPVAAQHVLPLANAPPLSA